MKRILAVTAVAFAQALLVGSCGEEQAGGYDIVAAYCWYGSVSREQVRTCSTHVTDDEIHARDTEAAGFAEQLADPKAGLPECGPEAGPLCEDYLSAVKSEEQDAYDDYLRDR